MEKKIGRREMSESTRNVQVENANLEIAVACIKKISSALCARVFNEFRIFDDEYVGLGPMQIAPIESISSLTRNKYNYFVLKMWPLTLFTFKFCTRKMCPIERHE